MSVFPRITIVTPSFNQAQFLEQTIQSVLDQRYPNLQYGVIDGGSTDGSDRIIERYRRHLAFAVIEPDRGQAEAINKGLRRADGDVVGWLCSDDLLLPGALAEVGTRFAQTSLDWIAGGVRVVDEAGQGEEVQWPCGDFSVRGILMRGRSSSFSLPQPGVFWRRTLHDRLGLLREDLHYCMDFEWWLRLSRAGCHPMLVDRPLAAYRLHDASKSVAQRRGFLREHLAIEPAYAGSLPFRDRFRLARRMGYLRRTYALERHESSAWRLVARRPWWLLSQQVRGALRITA